MAHKKGGPSNRLLTEVELELMTIVWQAGTVTVKDVVNALPKGRALAHTSVATVIKLLKQKGFLACQKSSHSHTYWALVPKDEYEYDCVEDVVNNVFGGEPIALVQRLLDRRNLSAGDLQALQATLKQLGSRKGLHRDDTLSRMQCPVVRGLSADTDLALADVHAVVAFEDITSLLCRRAVGLFFHPSIWDCSGCGHWQRYC